MRRDRFQFTGIASLEDIKVIEQTPLSQQDIPDSAFEGFAEAAKECADDIALTYFLQGKEYQQSYDFTYRQALEKTHQIANLFHDLGFGKDDVVALILPNLPETTFCLTAIPAVGIVMPINPLLDPQHWVEILNAAGAKAIITIGPFLRTRTDIWEKVNRIRHEVPSIKHIFQVDMSNYLEGFKKSLVRFIIGFKSKGKSSPQQQIWDFNEKLSSYNKEQLDFTRQTDPQDTAAYFHTGGTTGVPKIAMQSHRNICFNVWANGNNVDTTDDHQTMFCGLPLFHVLGAMVTLYIPFSGGARIVMGSPRGYRDQGVVDNIWKIVEHYQINYLAAVPALYKQFTNVPVGSSDISSIKMAVCGGAALPVEVYKNFEKTTGVRILEGYGCTEATCTCASNPLKGDRKIGSIGFAIPYSELRAVVLDEEGQFIRFCETDEIGTIITRGDHVFKGYKSQVHNRKVWINTGDGKGHWYNTGDLGRRDANGYYWLTGRKKELIIRGGHNIDPKMIEEPMYKHKAVAVAAAVGRPDPKVGEIPVLYVELEANQKCSTSDLLAFAQTHISERAAIPKAIYLIDKMPMTSLDKIFKPDLIKREIKDVYSQEIKAINGINLKQIEVINDRKRGMVAELQFQQAPNQIQQQQLQAALGTYAIAYEIK